MNPSWPVRFPDPHYALRTARDAAALFLLIRAAGLFAGPAALSPLAGLIALVATAALVWLDARRFHEHLFHANLGTSPAWSVGISAAVAGALEVLAQVLFRALI